MTNYQKVGEGKVIICLHGWGDTSDTFSKLIEQLKDRYLIYAVDLPGFGSSQAPPEAWGLSEYADFVASWLEKINIKKIYALIGHSNGGAIAVQGLADGSLKSEKLVLLASAGIRDQNQLRKNILSALAQIGKIIMSPLNSTTKKRLKSKAYQAIGSDIAVAPKLEESFRKIVRQDIQSAAQKLQMPALLIYGDKDQQTPLYYGELLAKVITGSKLEVISSGHFVHQEQPEQIVDLLADFLDK